MLRCCRIRPICGLRRADPNHLHSPHFSKQLLNDLNGMFLWEILRHNRTCLPNTSFKNKPSTPHKSILFHLKYNELNLAADYSSMYIKYCSDLKFHHEQLGWGLTLPGLRLDPRLEEAGLSWPSSRLHSPPGIFQVYIAHVMSNNQLTKPSCMQKITNGTEERGRKATLPLNLLVKNSINYKLYERRSINSSPHYQPLSSSSSHYW